MIHLVHHYRHGGDPLALDHDHTRAFAALEDAEAYAREHGLNADSVEVVGPFDPYVFSTDELRLLAACVEVARNVPGARPGTQVQLGDLAVKVLSLAFNQVAAT